MAQGRKPADGTLNGEFEHAMDILDGSKDPVAMYLIDWHVRRIKRSSAARWKEHMRKHKAELIGVYDQGADARCVLADIRVLWDAANWQGVDIDAVHREAA